MPSFFLLYYQVFNIYIVLGTVGSLQIGQNPFLFPITLFFLSGENTSSGRKVSPCSLDISDKLFCSACDQVFQNHQEQREHYKLDWHRFNLKQRLKNKPLLSASDFERQSSRGDLSSISGSEDSDSASEEDLLTLDEERAESEKPNRPPGFYPHRVLFRNAQGQFLYAYRCVLGPHQASNSTGCVISASFCILGFLQPMYVLFSSFWVRLLYLTA